MKKSRYSIQLVSKIFLILTTLLISLPSPASMRLIISDSEISGNCEISDDSKISNDCENSGSELPKVPPTGTPREEQSAVAGSRGHCSDTAQKQLTALFANNSSDFTVSEYPTFWFYIPDSPEQIGYMEFVLKDALQNQIVYRKAVKLTNKAGIIKISIPANPQYALKVNDNYRWHFYLECAPDSDKPFDSVTVKGWIRRVPMTSQLANHLEAVPSQDYLAYQEEGIWYNAIANLAEQHFANPGNGELSTAWTNLLKSLNLPWVSEEPLVNSELLPPKEVN